MSPANLASVLALCPVLVLAQTTAVVHQDLSRGINLPPNSAAFADEATAIALNPAGLRYVGPFQLLYAHERSILRNQVSDGVYAGATLFHTVGAGFSLEWIRSNTGVDYRKTAYALSLGSDTLALGASYNLFTSAENADLDALSSFDVGLMSRPFRQGSFGFYIRNIEGPSRNLVTLPRQYDLALGIRPFGERITFGVDYLFDDDRGFDAGRLGYTLQARLIPGLTLLGGLSHGFRTGDDLFFQVGASLDTAHFGATYAGGGAPGGSNHVVQARFSAQRYPSIVPQAGTVALFNLDRLLSESVSSAAVLLGAYPTDPYLRLTRLLEESTEDAQLRAVIFKVDGMNIGLAKALELRSAIERLQARGKKVYAVVLSASDVDYLAISSADKIYAVPGSVLLLDGLSASTTFLGEAMDKLGVQWEVARVGAYKNAPDQLTRSEMSPEQREAINAYLDTNFRVYLSRVARSRQLTEAHLRTALDEGMKSPQRAKELGLIDEVIDPQALDELLKRLVPGGRFDPNYRPRRTRDDRWGQRQRIAIVPVIGAIAGGKSRQDPVGLGETAGAETVVRAIKQAEEDPLVSAIVVRVDSGGGDTLASDLMYRAVLEAKKKKPVIASMGDVAASGGYYVSMGADAIFAEPTTVTGSIGVFFIKPAVAPLANKLGIHNETIRRGALAGMLGLFHPWTEPERQAAQRWVDAFYDEFISEVARSRKLAKEQVDAVARGRVWSGEDAQSRGLVDELGGLSQAIAEARRRAGLRLTEEVDLVIISEPPGLLVGAGPAVAQILGTEGLPSSPWLEWVRATGVDPSSHLQHGLQARMEFTLTVK